MSSRQVAFAVTAGVALVVTAVAPLRQVARQQLRVTLYRASVRDAFAEGLFEGFLGLDPESPSGYG